MAFVRCVRIRRHKTRHHDHGCTVIVKSFKFLGVHLFKNNNWNRTQQRVAQHASHALHNCFIILNHTDLPISEQIKLYNTMVVPTLNYGAEIFGFHECKDIEVIHNKFCRKILCVKKSTNIDALNGELGLLLMSIQRKIMLINNW